MIYVIDNNERDVEFCFLVINNNDSYFVFRTRADAESFIAGNKLDSAIIKEIVCAF